MRKNKQWLITYVLIAMNILMYLISAFLSENIFDIDIRVLIYLGAKFNPLIDIGQYYRLVTCTFLHGGLMHIALNMYALYAIGPLIERTYGKSKFLLIYFVSGIMSSFFSYKFSSKVSIGASGAIFGLLGAALVLSIKMRRVIGEDFRRNIISVILVNIIIGVSISNIDNFGHLGGLVGGILVSMLIFKRKSTL